jgi:membrane protease YdiL (CAAX protease family)
MVALAVGLVARPHPLGGRLTGWVIFVLVFSSLNYAARFLLSDDSDNTEVAYEYGTSIAALLQYGLVFGIALLFARGHRDLLALRRPTSWRAVLWISVAILFLMLVLSAALSPITNPEEEQGLVPSHWDSHRIVQFALFAFVVTIVGPVVEELMFRGVGFGLLEFYGRWTAIIGVGIAFGLVHGLIEGLAIITAFGIGLAFLRARTSSVYPCMILHAVFNASALAIGVST